MYSIVPVADGVFAFIPPPTSSPVVSGNVVAVVGDDGVLVVDTGRFPTLARRIIADIRKKTGKPVRYIVHTHWHLDHIVGDAEFQKAFPGVAVVTTDFTRRKILEKQSAYLANLETTNGGYARQLDDFVKGGKHSDGSPLTEADIRFLQMEASDLRFEIAELAGATIVDPTVTFDKTLTVHLGKREVRVAFLGSGNTAGTPDLRSDAKVASRRSPSPRAVWIRLPSGGWIETPSLAATDDGRAGRAVLTGTTQEDHRRPRVDPPRSAVRDGATLEETRKRVDLTTFRNDFAGNDTDRAKAFRAFFADSAIERAWQEAKGALAEE
jgi:glyoxylase-like metal-dependent hydrolase (beta-lactamase superfamily II)